ncbi:hypothetical protein L1987_65068 [Smallanthus sonchifolius]|uniref:Uncharacterized protein n=1 Tax=Smallanthus sonchifolius TaxID=185202 RepID=A0ACB9BTF4_9ASTR|nr:hypothetical protein L1987_65068 [Smallanthus sonchifolius]
MGGSLRWFPAAGTLNIDKIRGRRCPMMVISGLRDGSRLSALVTTSGDILVTSGACGGGLVSGGRRHGGAMVSEGSRWGAGVAW